MSLSDEKGSVKHLLRIPGWRKHYPFQRQGNLNYDPLWPNLTALISLLPPSLCQARAAALGRRRVKLHLHICSFTTDIKRLFFFVVSHYRGRSEKNKLPHWWMSHFFSYLSGFSIFTKKGFIFSSKFRSIVVNVHYSDGHNRPWYLTVVS